MLTKELEPSFCEEALSHMSSYLHRLLQKEFLSLLGILVTVGLTLLALFSFAASSPPNLGMGLGLFVVATTLLIVGYMVGFMALAFLVLLLLAQLWQKERAGG